MATRPGKLAGGTAIVTGAESGIGRATPLLLAAEGALVLVVAGARGGASPPTCDR